MAAEAGTSSASVGVAQWTPFSGRVRLRVGRVISRGRDVQLGQTARPIQDGTQHSVNDVLFGTHYGDRRQPRVAEEGGGGVPGVYPD